MGSYWEEYRAPTKYADTLYHIGGRSSPCWLIESTEGLILLDTGSPKTLYQIVDNMRILGYDPRDVRHIIHSHGHIDHIGGTRALVHLSGAKTYIGRGDEKTVTGERPLSWCPEFKIPFEEPFTPDRVIEDGEIITIGNRTFEFIACPGHTEGTLSIFFNVTDGGKEYRAGTFGGGGLNSMTKEYLDRYSLPYSLREDFIRSIDKVMDEKVELHVGNHLGDNGHFDKLERMGGEVNPFIDGTTWKEFLARRRAEAIAKFESDPI